MRKSYSILVLIIFLTTSLIFFQATLVKAQPPSPVWPTVWLTPDCNTDPSDESPSQLDIISIDIVGDGYHPAVYYAEDENYLYLRERVEGDPNGPPGMFTQHNWVVVNEQTGDDYYDYLFTLNGNDELVQIWENTVKAAIIDWDPIFNDPAETVIWSGSTSVYARIDSDGEGHWFVSWTVPKTYGNFTLGENPTLYFSTSGNANNYNKDHLDCYEELFCGDGIVTEPEQCEYPDTFDNTYCSQTTQECLGFKLGTRDAFGDCDSICGCVYDLFTYQCVEGQCGAECDQDDDCPQTTEKCDYVNRVYCTRDGYGTCDENCECLEDNWICGDPDDEAFCLNCAHCGDGVLNCGEECEPGDDDEKRCLPEGASIFYCFNGVSYEVPEFDTCTDDCVWGGCEEIETPDDPRCVPPSPPTCKWCGSSYSFNIPTFTIPTFTIPTFTIPTFTIPTYTIPTYD